MLNATLNETLKSDSNRSITINLSAFEFPEYF